VVDVVRWPYFRNHLGFDSFVLLLLLDLEEKRTIDVGKNTTEGDCRADEGVQLLVAANGELQVARRDALDLEILGGVAGQLEDFGGEVLEDGSDVDGSWESESGNDCGWRGEGKRMMNG
jgi:hypothetical protein